MTQAKMIFALVAAVVLTLLVVFGGQQVLKWREGAAQNEARGHTLESTSGTIADGNEADVDRGKTDQGVASGRGAYNDAYRKGESDDPETADRSSRPVPDGVRNAFRERRLARERSGCAGIQCVQGPEPSPPPER